jgi:hypothetical protein
MANPKGRSPMAMMAEALEAARHTGDVQRRVCQFELMHSSPADASHSDAHTLAVLRWLLAAMNGENSDVGAYTK